MTVAPGQTLSHYRLVEKIGEGGMGVVWKAEDTVLGRTVAIKVLPADVARDEKRRQMFFDEAKLASAVSEAHIVQVHEFGQEGDLGFIVMEYVEGKPLSKILHGRPLPPDKVADIGYQVARALSRAHRKGLLHRDLKPSNILVTPDGDVKVVDFGLATLFSPGDATLGTAATTKSLTAHRVIHGKASEHETVVGTLPYMAPEQVRGEKLDARSDVFSLGVVLYEMTTGQRPFAGATTKELVGEIQKARPRPVHELVPKVPLDLHKIIEKALAARSGERYQTTEDLAVDLKRLSRDLDSGSSPSYEDLKTSTVRRRPWAWAFVIVLVAAAVAVGLWLTSSLWWPKPDAHTVMILPMEVRGQTEGADYLGRAFSETIGVNLAQSVGLKVLPVPQSGDLPAGGGMTLAAAAQQMGADRLVTGSLTREGSQIGASVNLVDATENRILWGDQEVATDSDPARLATVFAGKLMELLGVEKPRVYEYFRYVTGSPAMAGDPDLPETLGALRRHDIERGLPLTERLIERYPNELEAHVMRIVALVDAVNAEVTEETLRAVNAGLDALERVDPQSPNVPVHRAHYNYREDPNGAVTLLDPVVARTDLTPALRAHALRYRANALAKQKKLDQAIADLRKAILLDPANPYTYNFLSWRLRESGELEEALVRARQAYALDPESGYFQDSVAQVLEILGKEDEGKLEEALAIRARHCEEHDTQQACVEYALALQRAGQLSMARSVADKAKAMPDDAEGCASLAVFWALDEKPKEAVKALERSVRIAGPLASKWIMDSHYFSTLHADPGYEAIVAEIKQQIEAQD